MGTKKAGVFEMDSMKLDGTWQAYDLTGGNMFILQCRDNDNNIQVSRHPAGKGGYFTIKAGQSLPLSSVAIDTGTQGNRVERMYVHGVVNAVLEIFKQKTA